MSSLLLKGTLILKNTAHLIKGASACSCCCCCACEACVRRERRERCVWQRLLSAAVCVCLSRNPHTCVARRPSFAFLNSVSVFRFRSSYLCSGKISWRLRTWEHVSPSRFATSTVSASSDVCNSNRIFIARVVAEDLWQMYVFF